MPSYINLKYKVSVFIYVLIIIFYKLRLEKGIYDRIDILKVNEKE